MQLGIRFSLNQPSSQFKIEQDVVNRKYTWLIMNGKSLHQTEFDAVSVVVSKPIMVQVASSRLCASVKSRGSKPSEDQLLYS